MDAARAWIEDVAARLAQTWLHRPAGIVWLSVDLAQTLRSARVAGAQGGDFADALVHALLAHAAPDTTILVSAFNFQFPSTKRFDPAIAPAQTGAFGALLAQRYPEKRTANPFYSFVAFGPAGADLAARRFPNSFGPDSVFEWLVDRRVDLLSLGHHYVKALTGTHHAENMAQVSYRYAKSFSGDVIRDGRAEPATISFYVRDVERCDHSSLTETGDALLRAQGLVGSLLVQDGPRPLLAHHLALAPAHDLMVASITGPDIAKAVDYHGPGRDNAHVGVITAERANRLYLEEMAALGRPRS